MGLWRVAFAPCKLASRQAASQRRSGSRASTRFDYLTFPQRLTAGDNRARARRSPQRRRSLQASGGNRGPRSDRSALVSICGNRLQRLAGIRVFRIRTCSEPDLRCSTSSRPSKDRPRCSGPVERLSSRRSSRATLEAGPHFTPFPPASSCVAVGLPLTRQRGNRPGFLPSE